MALRSADVPCPGGASSPPCHLPKAGKAPACPTDTRSAPRASSDCLHARYFAKSGSLWEARARPGGGPMAANPGENLLQNQLKKKEREQRPEERLPKLGAVTTGLL